MFDAKNITCNAIAPGFIATDMTADISAENNPLAASIPLGLYLFSIAKISTELI